MLNAEVANCTFLTGHLKTHMLHYMVAKDSFGTGVKCVMKSQWCDMPPIETPAIWGNHDTTTHLRLKEIWGGCPVLGFFCLGSWWWRHARVLARHALWRHNDFLVCGAQGLLQCACRDCALCGGQAACGNMLALLLITHCGDITSQVCEKP